MSFAKQPFTTTINKIDTKIFEPHTIFKILKLVILLNKLITYFFLRNLNFINSQYHLQLFLAVKFLHI